MQDWKNFDEMTIAEVKNELEEHLHVRLFDWLGPRTDDYTPIFDACKALTAAEQALHTTRLESSAELEHDALEAAGGVGR